MWQMHGHRFGRARPDRVGAAGRSIHTMADTAASDESASETPQEDHRHGGHGADVLDPLNVEGKTLRKHIPEVYRGFAQTSRAAMADGELDARTKELIALAVSVATTCDGCIAAHAKGAVRSGATRQQAAEAIGVALFLSGGPGTVYGPRAFDAFCEFADAREAAGTPPSDTSRAEPVSPAPDLRP
jgi:AhpD family alkylhydroperoxidase